MKKFIKEWVENLGGSVSYSGNTRTMYAHDIPAGSVESIKKQFPTLSFKLVKD